MRFVSTLLFVIATFGTFVDASRAYAQDKSSGQGVVVLGRDGGNQYHNSFAGAEMGGALGGGRLVVKGAPFSATATTETTQTLADGNRITRQNTKIIHRDSDGRTRQDWTMNSIGAWPTSGAPIGFSQISDPVAGTSFWLFPKLRTASFFSRSSIPKSALQALPNQLSPTINQGASLPRCTDNVFTTEHGGIECLGKQVIEGVEAVGTRTTNVIQAGEIGNAQAIEVTYERWYSPELQTTVMSKCIDPRFGEAIFRLANIKRDEPERKLFEVPADYTMKPIVLAPSRPTSDPKRR